MTRARNFLILAILLVLIGLGADRGRHVEPLMTRDALALAPDGMVDTSTHEAAHAKVEAIIGKR